MEEQRTLVGEEKEHEQATDEHEPPRLIELGDYVELTRGTGGIGFDGGEVS